MKICTGFGGAGRRARGIRRCRRTADDLVGTRLTATAVNTRERGALTGLLLVPEHVELVPRRRLNGQPQRSVSPASRLYGRTTEVGNVRPLGGIAEIQVREHAGNGAVAAFVAELAEEPGPVFLDGTAEPDVVIPQFSQRPGRRQFARFQVGGVIVANHPVGDTRQVNRSFDDIAARFGHDAQRGPADFGLAHPARRRERDLLRVADVGNVARHSGAVECRAGVQAIHLDAAFVVAATGTAEDEHSGRHLDVQRGAGLSHRRRNERHDPGVRPCRGQRRDDVVAEDRLPLHALGVDNRTLSGDGDRFLDGANLHFGIHRGGERPGQLDPFTFERVESGERERDDVAAGTQIDNPVLTRAVGGGGSHSFDEGVARGFDCDSREHSAGRIFDGSRDRCLRQHDPRREDHERDCPQPLAACRHVGTLPSVTHAIRH